MNRVALFGVLVTPPMLLIVTTTWAADRVPVPASDMVTVSLRATATPTDKSVLVRDVAEVRGRMPELVKTIGALDLAEVPARGKCITIHRDGVVYRLLVAGIDRSAFQIQGAAQTIVRAPGRRIAVDDLIALARQTVHRRLPWPDDTVTIQLVQPPAPPNLNLDDDDKVVLEAEMRPSGRLVGRVYVDVVVIVNGQRRAHVPVGLDVKLHQFLAVATRRIEADEMLGPENLHQDRRVVDGVTNYPTHAECLAGMKAKRAIAAGSVLTREDVALVNMLHPKLVKAHDLVKLVATVGPIRVVTLGEAMQDGSAGQMIRVQNIDSKKAILGKVIDKNMVEVGY